ncbi:MAG: phosphohydrolase [Oscillospiraceae bacterium]|nr:phosphohydrolase [Oscillospiraceae bacterium]
MEHITTYSGEDFFPANPDINQIHIEDIAHALSMMCRANGHFVRFYSVAQHCLNCASEAESRGYSRRVQLACLLHDASEAYISDVTRPVKIHLPQYRLIEKRLQEVIYVKFLGSPLTDEESDQVGLVDNDLLVVEFDSMMRKRVFDKVPDMKSSPVLEFVPFVEVEREFVGVYNTINN